MEEGQFTPELDRPIKSGPEAYLASVLFSIGEIDRVISNMSGPTDRRPYLLLRQLISRIPSDEIRTDLFDKLDEEMQRIKETYEDVETQGKAVSEIIAPFTGAVIAYFDEFVGIERKQIIAPV
jgi:hypothetical protein